MFNDVCIPCQSFFLRHLMILQLCQFFASLCGFDCHKRLQRWWCTGLAKILPFCHGKESATEAMGGLVDAEGTAGVSVKFAF
jgi:hypothetical protein